MTAAKQMNAARKAVRNAAKTNKDISHLHGIAIEVLSGLGMNQHIVTKMAMSAMLDVVCGI